MSETLERTEVDWKSDLKLQSDAAPGSDMQKLIQDLVSSASTIASRAGTSVISPAHIK